MHSKIHIKRYKFSNRTNEYKLGNNIIKVYIDSYSGTQLNYKYDNDISFIEILILTTIIVG